MIYMHRGGLSPWRSPGLGGGCQTRITVAGVDEPDDMPTRRRFETQRRRIVKKFEV